MAKDLVYLMLESLSKKLDITQYGLVKTINAPGMLVETLHVTSLQALTEPYWHIPVPSQVRYRLN
jgi:hypothetical protein